MENGGKSPIFFFTLKKIKFKVLHVDKIRVSGVVFVRDQEYEKERRGGGENEYGKGKIKNNGVKKAKQTVAYYSLISFAFSIAFFCLLYCLERKKANRKYVHKMHEVLFLVLRQVVHAYVPRIQKHVIMRVQAKDTYINSLISH